MSRKGVLSWRIDWIRNSRITDSKGDLFRPGHKREVHKVKSVNVRPAGKANSSKTMERGQRFSWQKQQSSTWPVGQARFTVSFLFIQNMFYSCSGRVEANGRVICKKGFEKHIKVHCFIVHSYMSRPFLMFMLFWTSAYKDVWRKGGNFHSLLKLVLWECDGFTFRPLHQRGNDPLYVTGCDM
jgi:hypothetical protein